MKPPVHVQVDSRDHESSEHLVKRFIRKFKNGKFQELFLEKFCGNAHFEKRSIKRKRKMEKAQRQREKDLRKRKRRR